LIGTLFNFFLIAICGDLELLWCVNWQKAPLQTYSLFTNIYNWTHSKKRTTWACLQQSVHSQYNQ